MLEKLVYWSNCVIKLTLNKVSKNQPIKPSIMAAYLPMPRVGISPKPSVVKELMLNTTAFKTFITSDKTRCDINIKPPTMAVYLLFFLSNSIHFPFNISALLKNLFVEEIPMVDSWYSGLEIQRNILGISNFPSFIYAIKSSKLLYLCLSCSS